jgi:hypothetical protein
MRTLAPSLPQQLQFASREHAVPRSASTAHVVLPTLDDPVRTMAPNHTDSNAAARSRSRSLRPHARASNGAWWAYAPWIASKITASCRSPSKPLWADALNRSYD